VASTPRAPDTLTDGRGVKGAAGGTEGDAEEDAAEDTEGIGAGEISADGPAEAVTVTVAVAVAPDAPVPPEHAERPTARVATASARVTFDVLFTRRNDLTGSGSRSPATGSVPRTHTGQRRLPKVVTMDSGLILLIFLAFLVAWGLNRVRRAFRLGPVAYAGIMVVFVIVMLAVWGQTFR